MNISREQILALAEKCGEHVKPTGDFLEAFYHAAIAAYKAELLKEVGEPETIFDLTVFTSDQVAAAVAKATKPLEDQLAKAEHRVAEACATACDGWCYGMMGQRLREGDWRKFLKEV